MKIIRFPTAGRAAFVAKFMARYTRVLWDPRNAPNCIWTADTTFLHEIEPGEVEDWESEPAIDNSTEEDR